MYTSFGNHGSISLIVKIGGLSRLYSRSLLWCTFPLAALLKCPPPPTMDCISALLSFPSITDNCSSFLPPVHEDVHIRLSHCMFPAYVQHQYKNQHSSSSPSHCRILFEGIDLHVRKVLFVAPLPTMLNCASISYLVDVLPHFFSCSYSCPAIPSSSTMHEDPTMACLLLLLLYHCGSSPTLTNGLPHLLFPPLLRSLICRTLFKSLLLSY